MSAKFTIRNDEPEGGKPIYLKTVKNDVEGGVIIQPGDEYGCDTSFATYVTDQLPEDAAQPAPEPATEST